MKSDHQGPQLHLQKSLYSSARQGQKPSEANLPFASDAANSQHLLHWTYLFRDCLTSVAFVLLAFKSCARSLTDLNTAINSLRLIPRNTSEFRKHHSQTMRSSQVCKRSLASHNHKCRRLKSHENSASPDEFTNRIRTLQRVLDTETGFLSRIQFPSDRFFSEERSA